MSLAQEGPQAEALGLHAGKDCPLCGRPGQFLFYKDGVACRTCCGTLLAWGWPSPAAYEAQYLGTAYHEDACRKLGLPAQWERFEEHRKAGRARMQWISRQLNGWPDRMLDVGAGNAALIVEARASAVQAEGIEPSAAMCRWVWSEQAIPLWCGTWQEIAGQWDLITATDVIEHLLYPEAFLKRCRRHARYLHLETPDWTEACGPEWRHVKPLEHLCCFSEGALLALTRRAGWAVKALDRPVPTKLAVLLERT